MSKSEHKALSGKGRPPAGHSDPTAVAAALDEVRRKPTVSVTTAGLVLGLGINVSYREADKGTIPTIRLGRQLRVPSSKLLDLLGLKSDTAPVEQVAA
jgi:hypothetical protein